MANISSFAGSYASTKNNLDLERRFSCVVCLAPKFRMVYGLCQHKICTSCAYNERRVLKKTFRRCPTCQEEDVFPKSQPGIPEDNIVAQELCGVGVCKYKDCGEEVWVWEKEDHEQSCAYRQRTPKNRYQLVKNDSRSISTRSSSRRRMCKEIPYYTRSSKRLNLKALPTSLSSQTLTTNPSSLQDRNCFQSDWHSSTRK